MHTLENIGFLRMVVLSKQTLYGQIIVELEENWNDCKNFLGGDIGFKLSQVLSNDVEMTFLWQKFIKSIVFIVFLLFSIVLRQ